LGILILADLPLVLNDVTLSPGSLKFRLQIVYHCT